MTDKAEQNLYQEISMVESLKSWAMLALTMIFVLLYAAALLGWLKPLTDMTMVTRIEPIIFVIIGYYFGRLPAQQNEKTLKEEINRQTKKADIMQHVKEQTQQERDTLEEKIKNVKTVLSSTVSALSKAEAESLSLESSSFKDKTLKNSVSTAINILDS